MKGLNSESANTPHLSSRRRRNPTDQSTNNTHTHTTHPGDHHHLNHLECLVGDNMRLGIALTFIVVAIFPPQTECATTTCQLRQPNDLIEGPCLVKLTSVPQIRVTYNECITVHVWMKDIDFCNNPRIHIRYNQVHEQIPSILNLKPKKCVKERLKSGRIRCNASSALWELVHDCVPAEVGHNVQVSYRTGSTSCNANYTVPDPTPEFHVSVNKSSKSFTVSAEPGNKVYIRWCYRTMSGHCFGDGNLTTIDPSQTPSTVINVPYLLPCTCVEVYYTYSDAKRPLPKCPLRNTTITDVSDVWYSAKVELYEQHLVWRSKCPISDVKISASLCWKQHEHLCTAVFNLSQVETEERNQLKYNTSAVDKHPQMCVQFSLHGSHRLLCPFEADMASWEVNIEPDVQRMFVYITSSVAAKFSAQLCILMNEGCTPIGLIHSGGMDNNNSAITINVPLSQVAQKPCVQVWQSGVALHGKRILCPDYTHNRRGMYAVAALVFVVSVTLLGMFIHRLTKRGAAGWLYIQKPVLLVCSSEHPAHISAVCALASILQADLGATVHLALWAQSSQTQPGTGVVDLGPIPWLYGQWETVLKAQGNVLIIWTPEAKQTYEQWWNEMGEMDKSDKRKEDYSKTEKRFKKPRADVEENLRLHGLRLEKCKEDRTEKRKDKKKDWCPQNEPCTVVAPMFKAALACLMGAIQENKDERVAFVYIQGHGHSKDIPRAFRSTPRYCLPQEFRGLIQELGGTTKLTENTTFRWHCWPRLVSKVLSLWLARQLTHRLEMLLPQTQEKKTKGLRVTSSEKMKGKLKLPLAADTNRPGTTPEQEPLYRSPWRPETPPSQVSVVGQTHVCSSGNMIHMCEM